MRIPSLAGALLATVAAPWCVWPQSPVTVAVFNCAGVPHSILAPAVETARRAFLCARIESRWLLCGAEGCPQQLPAGSYLELFVMPRLRAPLTDRADTHPAGYAMPDTFAHPRAYAFYDAARMVAERTLRPLDVVLGCIFIHEAGHLLGLRHQPHGAMRADLDAADMDSTAMGRAFNGEEGRKLRAAVNPSPKLRAAAPAKRSEQRPDETR